MRVCDFNSRDDFYAYCERRIKLAINRPRLKAYWENKLYTAKHDTQFREQKGF